MSNEDEDLYSLDKLIEMLEEMRKNGGGQLSIPKAIYCLAKEIEKVQKYQEYLHKIIPGKYKKFNPKESENPFFSHSDITVGGPSPADFTISLWESGINYHDISIPDNEEQLEFAKVRMNKLLEESKQEPWEATS